MTFRNYPHLDRHTDRPLTLRTGPDKAISPKEAEQSKADVPSPLSPTYLNLDKNQKSQRSSPTRSPLHLGTNHLDPYLKTLNSLLEQSDDLLLQFKLEAGHEVPHLDSVRRNVNRLTQKAIRVARVVGRLYGNQGWDLPYNHASNTAVERKLRARGGYDALRAAQRQREIEHEQ